MADTGIGIAKELLPIIFGMFRLADSSETRLYGGVDVELYREKVHRGTGQNRGRGK